MAILAALLIMVGAIGILLVPLLFDGKIGILRDDIDEITRGRQEATQQLTLAMIQYHGAMRSHQHKEILKAQGAINAAMRRQTEAEESLRNAAKLMVVMARAAGKISPKAEQDTVTTILGLRTHDEIWPIYQKHFSLVSSGLNEWFSQLRLHQQEIARVDKKRARFWHIFVLCQALGMAIGVFVLFPRSKPSTEPKVGQVFSESASSAASEKPSS